MNTCVFKYKGILADNNNISLNNYMDHKELLKRSKEFLDYETPQKHTWCSGCGNYGILNAMTRALVLEGISPQKAMLCNEVGCNGNVSDKIMTNTFHGLHGRVIPLASGMSVANRNITVIASGGDGSTLSEGVNHFIHGIRNNFNITFILHNNKNYGLTTGQASSTTPKGYNMNSTPGETTIDNMNPLQLALSLNCSYVARGYSSNVDQLTDLIQGGIQHQGFSLIEVLQLCPTYNKATPEQWYLDRIYDVKYREDYDNSDIWQARRIVDDYEGDNKIATGLIYQDKNRPDYVATQDYRDWSKEVANSVENVNIDSLCASLV